MLEKQLLQGSKLQHDEVEVRLGKEQRLELTLTDLGNGVHNFSGYPAEPVYKANTEEDPKHGVGVEASCRAMLLFLVCC